MLIKKQNYVYRIKFYKDGIEILSFPLRYVECNYNYNSNGNSRGIVILKKVNLNIINKLKLANIYNNVYTMTIYNKVRSVINVLIKKTE